MLKHLAAIPWRPQVSWRVSVPSEAVPPSVLDERLRQVTEALASTSTVQSVLQAMLPAAVGGLGAVAGTALLLDAAGTRSDVAATHGQQTGTPAIWHGVSTPGSPAADALARRKTLYFEHAAALRAAYPEPGAPLGSPGGAVAVVPLLGATRALGVMVLEFGEPREFTPAGRLFLDVLGAQAALALDRAGLLENLHGQVSAQTAQLDVQLRAQDAYVAYTEAAGTETDVLALAHKAMGLLSLRFPGCSVGYYELEDSLWKLRAHTPDMEATPELLAQLRQGVPLDTPVIAAALSRREVVFEDGWDAAREGVERAAMYSTVAISPLLHGGEVVALLALGLQLQTHWQAPDRAIVRAVGRSLTLALERAGVATELQRQKGELESRNHALEAFARLAQDMAGETDRYALIRRAQELVLSLLTPGYAVYYEPEGQLWRLRAQVGDLGNPELQRIVDAGLPYDIPTLLVPWTGGEAFYQDVYAQGSDTPAEVIRQVNAAASLPLCVHGTPVGVFALGLFDQRKWTAADRAVLAITISSLGMALERAEGLQELERSNTELQASNRELEAFSYSVSHDLRAPVRHVLGFSTLALKATADLPETVIRHLTVIQQAATRMNLLIDAMLDHSRRARQELILQPVDLGEIVNQTIHDAAPDLEHRRVEWRVQPLPTVPGDVELLRQVMVNVLSNAVKFTRGEQHAVIEVWAEEAADAWTVTVRDNGAGFDPAYAHKLFTVFQRLHAERDFEGTGVGLATTQRILLRHGGDISAVGAVGQGATFRITLPKAPVPGS